MILNINFHRDRSGRYIVSNTYWSWKSMDYKETPDFPLTSEFQAKVAHLYLVIFLCPICPHRKSCVDAFASGIASMGRSSNCASPSRNILSHPDGKRPRKKWTRDRKGSDKLERSIRLHARWRLREPISIAHDFQIVSHDICGHRDGKNWNDDCIAIKQFERIVEMDLA